MKKNLFKKAVIVAMAGVMCLSLVACGKDDKKDKKTTATTASEDTGFDNPLDTSSEIITPDTSVPDITTENTEDTEDTTANTSSNTDTVNGVSFVIPDGYTKDSSSTSTSVTYVNSEGAAFVVAVDKANAINEANAISQFDTQIKNVFGTQVTNSPVSYADYEGTEWVTDAADGSYKGRSLVICDGSVLIYIEYVSYVGNLDAYSEIVESVQY